MNKEDLFNRILTELSERYSVDSIPEERIIFIDDPLLNMELSYILYPIYRGHLKRLELQFQEMLRDYKIPFESIKSPVFKVFKSHNCRTLDDYLDEPNYSVSSALVYKYLNHRYKSKYTSVRSPRRRTMRIIPDLLYITDGVFIPAELKIKSTLSQKLIAERKLQLIATHKASMLAHNYKGFDYSGVVIFSTPSPLTHLELEVLDSLDFVLPLVITSVQSCKYWLSYRRNAYSTALNYFKEPSLSNIIIKDTMRRELDHINQLLDKIYGKIYPPALKVT